MKRNEGRIFTTHTGSLPRPKDLTEVLGLLALGQPIDELIQIGLRDLGVANPGENRIIGTTAETAEEEKEGCHDQRSKITGERAALKAERWHER